MDFGQIKYAESEFDNEMLSKQFQNPQNMQIKLNTYSQIFDLFQSSQKYSRPLRPALKFVFQFILYPTN